VETHSGSRPNKTCPDATSSIDELSPRRMAAGAGRSALLLEKAV
jgi:hypothetical protein